MKWQSIAGDDQSFAIIDSNIQYLAHPLDVFLSKQMKLGAKKIAFYGCVPHIFVDHLGNDSCQAVYNMMRKFQILPEVFIPADYGYSLLADPASELGRASVSYYEHCIRVAKQLGATTVPIYAVGGLYSEDPERLWDSLIKNLQKICRTAEREGINLAVGGSAAKKSALPILRKELSWLLACIDCSGLSVTVDVDLIADVGESLTEWCSGFDEKICHVRVGKAVEEMYLAELFKCLKEIHYKYSVS